MLDVYLPLILCHFLVGQSLSSDPPYLRMFISGVSITALDFVFLLLLPEDLCATIVAIHLMSFQLNLSELMESASRSPWCLWVCSPWLLSVPFFMFGYHHICFFTLLFGGWSCCDWFSWGGCGSYRWVSFCLAFARGGGGVYTIPFVWVECGAFEHAVLGSHGEWLQVLHIGAVSVYLFHPFMKGYHSN